MAFGRCTSAFESLGMCRHRLMMAWSRWGMVGLQPMHFSQATPKCFRYLQMASICSCEWHIFWGIMLCIAMLKFCCVPLCNCDHIRAFQYNIYQQQYQYISCNYSIRSCNMLSYEWQLRLEVYDSYSASIHICIFITLQIPLATCHDLLGSSFCCFCWQLNALPLCPQLCQNMWSLPLESASWALFDRRNLSMYPAHN